jgi:membrane fusion protein, multidrug efflux system
MKGWLRAIALLVAAILLFAGIRVIRAGAEPAPVPTERDLEVANGLPVEVAPVEMRTVRPVIRVFGVARGLRQAEVFAPSPNVLEDLHVVIGQVVGQGQVLASLRETARTPLGYPYGPASAKNDAVQADLARFEALFAQGAITESDVEHARAQARASKADFEAARSAVQVTSPISGMVTRIDFREGDMVPADRPLVQVAVIDEIVVDFMVEPVDVVRVTAGQPVEVLSSALPGRSFLGRVVERALAAHPVLGQFRVRVEVENPERAILPGFPLEGHVELGAAEPVLAVPADALVTRDGATGVWTVPDGNLAHWVPVVEVLSDSDHVAVEGALSPGDRVVTLGRADLRQEGQKVIIVGSGR